MQKRLTQILSLMIVGIIMASCASTNDVVSDRRIQKRKYNKGFFFDFDKKWGKTGQETDAIATVHQEDVNEINEEKTTPALVESTTEFPTDVSTTPAIEMNDVESSMDQNIAFNQNSTELSSETKEVAKIVRKDAGGLKSPAKTLKAIKSPKKASSNSNQSSDVPMVLLIILTFLLPWLAVGLYTDWDTMKTLISFLLWLFFWVPGIIYALLVIFDVI